MRLLRNKNTGAIFDWTSALAQLDYMEIYEPKMDVMIEPLQEELPIEGLEKEITHDDVMNMAIEVLEKIEEEEKVRNTSYKRKK